MQKYGFNQDSDREMDFMLSADDFAVNSTYISVAINSLTFTISLFSDATLFLHYGTKRVSKILFCLLFVSASLSKSFAITFYFLS